nr:putative ribonuclease H-like domain-containing protein [Tanacetum cinerariifolium]
MTNKTVGIRVGPVHSRNKVNHQNQFVPQAVLLRTGKVNIPHVRPQLVPTGKPRVFAPVPIGRPNRPFLVPTGRGYSPSVIFAWWERIDGQLLLSPQQVVLGNHIDKENPFLAAQDEGIFDSGCSRSMTGDKERLDGFQAFQGRKVTFGGCEGRITRKGTIRTLTLDFENVYYVKELQQFNLFSISQICDKKNHVLFTDTECLVLSKDFKLPNDSMVILKVLRKHNLYTINLNDLYPRGNLACLVEHASFDESVKWHRRMGHVNYKNMNRLVKGNLVRGLPPKLFKHDHTYVACCKGKQHKASYKAIHVVRSISEPLQLLYMDLFGPTLIRSINHKCYCLVITDDYNRFCCVFFLEHKDETYLIFKDFINLVENQLKKKVKAIRCDNGIEFKNAHMIALCGSKGIKREYSNAKTLQQNGVAERKNKTLIEAARTMLADSKLPTMFWTEAVRTACHVMNQVSVTSPHNKTPYALLTRNIPSIRYLIPFGCHVTILNTSDHLGKFDGKADEGYIVGYSASNKAYKVYNVPNKRVEESMNLRLLEEKPNVQGLGHEWYFDLDYLTDTLGYKHVQANQTTGTQGDATNPVGTQDVDSESNYNEQVIIIPFYPSHSIHRSKPKDTPDDKVDNSPFHTSDEIFQKELARLKVPIGSIPVPTGSILVPAGDTMVSTDDVPAYPSSSTGLFFGDEPTTRFPCPSDLGNQDPSPGIFSSSSYDDEFSTTLNNVASTVEVSPVATKRINTIHPQSLIIGDPTLAVQTRSKEEMQQFKFQNVWVLVDFPTVAKIEAIRLFLAFASYMGFLVHQMDVKSAFLYGRIDEEAWCDEFEALMKGEFQMSVMGKLTFFLATTPYEALKPKSKNESDSPVNAYLYRSMIGSLMYLTASRPDIMFAVSACSRNQVTPTTLNLEAVKKIFKYLKGQPKLGIWYPKESPLVLEAYSDSDYAGANKDRKSTTGGCTLDTKSVV